LACTYQFDPRGTASTQEEGKERNRQGKLWAGRGEGVSTLEKASVIMKGEVEIAA